MKALAAAALVAVAAIVVTFARAGHEFPVYPSYYPHEIRIEAVAPGSAPALLRDAKIQAYVGSGLGFAGALPDSLRAVESLGSFVVVRVNPQSALAKNDASACRLGRAVLREIASRHGELRFHPYPVTPFHGDYLYHADLADEARRALLEDARPGAGPQPKVRATDPSARTLIRTGWIARGPQWDASIEEVRAADLVAGAATQLNGWLGPPWLRAGWFQAALLLGPALDDPQAHERVQAALGRLETRAYEGGVARINLERELVGLLARSCRTMVAGYTVEREYVNVDYSAGIENIGSDALSGLASPIFLRTAKLKDFPWNGWLSLGVATPPAAAWNPVAGFTDAFGRLMWAAVGDAALLPAPGDAGWMLNRISDVQAAPSVR